MTLHTYDIGEDIDLIGKFTDPDTGDPVTPSSVTVTVYRPETLAVVAPPPVAVEGPTGTFTAVFAPTEKGRWRWRMEGSGAATAIERGQFQVRPNL